MSLNEILSTALTGLSASQAGLRSVSNNIANVNTPGYAREIATQSTAVTAGRIGGVAVGEPTRVADRFLEGTVYSRAGEAGRSDVSLSYYDQLQALLGKPGDTFGLPARLNAIMASAAEMTGSADATSATATFLGNAQDAITSLHQTADSIAAMRADIDTGISNTVGRINDLLKQIDGLNDDVARLSAFGKSTSGVDDQRLTALQELSGLMSVTVRQQTDGRVTIETTSGQVLLDQRLRQLDYPKGNGSATTLYSDITIRFANADGTPGAATGDTIASSAVGGKLGGLIDMRDKVLPQATSDLNALFTGLAQTLNAVSNAGAQLPAPASLQGRNTGLVATDRLGFTGKATFAVVKADGTLVAKANVDFDTLGPTATVQDAVDAINAGLGGAGTASFANGALTIIATDATNGIATGQDPTTPSSRSGIGFAQYFGLNDVVKSGSGSLVPSGFTAADPHGFGTGETANILLRDANGKVLGSYAVTGSVGPTVGDIITELNASPLSAHGSFSLDGLGRIRFQPNTASQGATLSVSSDSTNRLGTGLTFSEWSGLSLTSSGLDTAAVSSALLAKPEGFPLALLDTNAAPGAKAIGPGDKRGATALVNALSSPIDLGRDGVTTLDAFSNALFGRIGTESARAKTAQAGAEARMTDAVARRDNFSGVNVEEELSQMVVLQNSYSAAARVVTTASDMYDTLIKMIG
ncbi:flagellar hook-associated protein FlgK [Sphingomonas sp. AP4-R1]|uniref:flagellar hook-associated protein FlgK n=1 Tax=Sphingomonas sp. AP4-R1 TaxID=2735134 RepID=UPI0014938D4C|nr:flagellar hook-associated protein FlgK [Sphingomonas sp. AP4-R1]QJU57428.1 flagellar hook-associated protein FlgK [Sphingomonas sp. AP4-R1]